MTGRGQHQWMEVWGRYEDVRDIYFRDEEQIAFSRRGTVPLGDVNRRECMHCGTFMCEMHICDAYYLCERPSPDMDERLQQSSGSFKHMPITHPPVREVQLWSQADSFAYDDCHRLEEDVTAGSEGEGVAFGTFLSVAGAITAEQWQLNCLVRGGPMRNTVELVGGREWSVCP